jgi:hypothetical protein
VEQDELLRFAVGALERAGAQYYVTGGQAAALWGEPRTTIDIDIVAELASWRVRDFCAEFAEPDFYVDPEAAMHAVRFGGMFNIIHVPSGYKLDIIASNDTPHDGLCFDRARRVDVGGREAAFASPEDIILKKLEYVRDHRSDKQMRDIAAIIRVRADQLDRGYIDQWSLRLGVRDAWEFVRNAVDRAGPEGNV